MRKWYMVPAMAVSMALMAGCGTKEGPVVDTPADRPPLEVPSGGYAGETSPAERTDDTGEQAEGPSTEGVDLSCLEGKEKDPLSGAYLFSDQFLPGDLDGILTWEGDQPYIDNGKVISASIWDGTAKEYRTEYPVSPDGLTQDDICGIIAGWSTWNGIACEAFTDDPESVWADTRMNLTADEVFSLIRDWDYENNHNLLEFYVCPVDVSGSPYQDADWMEVSVWHRDGTWDVKFSAGGNEEWIRCDGTVDDPYPFVVNLEDGLSFVMAKRGYHTPFYGFSVSYDTWG